jgi:hypothetical protein
LCADIDIDIDPDSDFDPDPDSDFDPDPDSDLDDEWSVSCRKGAAACSSCVRACSGDAPSVKADVGAVCKDAATPRSDTHQGPNPSPLIADHERVYAAPEPDRNARGACRRAPEAQAPRAASCAQGQAQGGR